MNGFKFSQRSKNNLQGVHADLVKIVYVALDLSDIDFAITEGLRSMERQKKLLAEGRSQTINSRHTTGHAIDVFAYPTSAGSWDLVYYQIISHAFKQASAKLHIPVEWGGDWKTFKDCVHFQLPYAGYSI